jgi:hypothetical protein
MNNEQPRFRGRISRYTLFLLFVSIGLISSASGFAHGNDPSKRKNAKKERRKQGPPDSTANTPPDSASIYPHAPGFALQDQYGISRSCLFPSSKIRLVTFADQKGTAYIEGWIRPIYQRYGDRIDIKGVAVLSAVPTMARGLVCAFIKVNVEYPVLLDWEGRISKQYEYENNTMRLVVIDRDGRIRRSLTGPASKARLQELFMLLDALARLSRDPEAVTLSLGMPMN